jgi:uridine kinase
MPERATRAQVIARVAELAGRLPHRTVFVGMDGFGGAGKSALADAVAAAVPRAQIVPVDDFWGPSIREWDWPRFEAQVLQALRVGATARYQVWDWVRDVGGEWVDVPPGRILIVEGVSATRQEVDAPWDLTIWVDAPQDVRLARARERDGEAMLHRWLDDWMPSEEAYAQRERPWERVDLIVSGTAQPDVDDA